MHDYIIEFRKKSLSKKGEKIPLLFFLDREIKRVVLIKVLERNKRYFNGEVIYT